MPDHVIILNERHLKRLMSSYLLYYHEMTAALVAMNAEDFMIGAPAAPTALGGNYLIFRIDPDRRDYTCKRVT